jgi:hypothetical protein
MATCVRCGRAGAPAGWDGLCLECRGLATTDAITKSAATGAERGQGRAHGGHLEGTWQSRGYRTASTRARCAQGLFLVVGVVLAWEVALAAQGNQFAHALADGRFVSSAELATWADNVDAAGNAYLVVAIGLAVAFIAWLSRTVDNVPPLGGGTPSDSPRWAVGWWFIPVAFLWKPYTVVRESWDRLATPLHHGRDKWVLGWWGCWIAGTVISRVANAWASSPNASYSYLETAYADQMLGMGLLVGAAVLGFFVVREIEARVRDRAVYLRLEQPSLRPTAVAPSPPAIAPASPNLTERLHQLQEAHERGLISDDEFAATRIELLRKL